MTRISKHDWAIKLASVTSERATCIRRSVGCVLLDIHGHVMSTGFNGVARGIAHCNEEQFSKGGPRSEIGDFVFAPNACPAAFAESGTNLDGCHAIHAEQNALLQCRDSMAIHGCYTTASPCLTCVKLLMNTSCEEIYFLEEYPHPTAKDLWLQSSKTRAWNLL